MVTKKKELKAKVSGVLLTAILILTMMPWHVMADDTSAAEGTAAANTVATESEGVSNEVEVLLQEMQHRINQLRLLRHLQVKSL